MEDLGRELHDFAQFAALTDSENRARRAAVESIGAIVKEALGDALSCEVFGSFSFALSLASSDIDVAIEGAACDDRSALELLADELLAKHAETYDVEALLDARVPLLKITDRETQLQIDVSVATDATRPSVASQLAFIAEHPVAQPVIVVLKALLRQWGLGNVVTGGLSSTALYLLVERYMNLVASHPSAANGKTLMNATSSGCMSSFGSPTSSRCPTPRSDGDWRSALCGPSDDTASSRDSQAGGSKAERYLAIAEAFLGVLQHASSEVYMFGFGLWDRQDPSNEVSRRTKRTMEIQALMKHTRNVLQALVQAGTPAIGGPATLLSAVAANPRQVFPPSPPAAAPPAAVKSVPLTIRVGGTRVA